MTFDFFDIPCAPDDLVDILWAPEAHIGSDRATYEDKNVASLNCVLGVRGGGGGGGGGGGITLASYTTFLHIRCTRAGVNSTLHSQYILTDKNIQVV